MFPIPQHRMSISHTTTPSNIFSSSVQTTSPNDSKDRVYLIAVPVLVAGCTVAVLLNSLVLLTAKYVRRPLNVTLKLTYSLAAADIWASVVIGVGLVSHSYLPFGLHMSKPQWQDCASYALEAMRLGGMLTAVFHLVALSLNHYSAIAYPVAYKSWTHSHQKFIALSIVIMWLAPPAAFFAVFAGYARETFAPTADRLCTHNFLHFIGFRIFVFFAIFVPLAAMTCVYVRIAVLLKTLQKQLIFKQPNRGLENGATGVRRSSFLRRKTGAVMTALCIVSTSLVGWLPAILLYVITCSTCAIPYMWLQITPWLLFSLTITSNALMILKGLVNPFIYAVRIPEIKGAVMYLVYCIRGRFQVEETTNTGAAQALL